ncbi:Histone acetyltransferase KAT6B [Echinococcus granulosus]|nr:Histone acetyltransferase KAT6B [Echinococcus granulosus]
MRSRSRVTQEELTKIISVINLLSSSSEKATVDTISSHLSNEVPSADRLSRILNEAVSRGSVVKNPEDGFYHPTRSLRPHRRSFLFSQHPSVLYDVTTPRRRTGSSIQRTHKTPNGAATSTRGISDIIPVCGFCLGDEANNPRTGEPEEMLACWGCGSSAHPSCLRLSAAMVPQVKRLRWYCIDCKRCTICHYSASNSAEGERAAVAVSGGSASDKDSDLLLCDNCDRGYHLSCVAPELTEPPDGTWICPICERYPEGYTQPEARPSSLGRENTLAAATATTVTQDPLDPRLQAAALCDLLTDYEVQLIRQALQSCGSASKAVTTSTRKPRASRPIKSEALLRPKRSGVLVQKTLTSWALRVESKQKSTDTTMKLEADNISSVGRVTTRRSIVNTTGASASISTTAGVPTTRLAARRSSAYASTDVSLTPPAKRCRLGCTASVASSLRVQIPNHCGPRRQQHQNYLQSSAEPEASPAPNFNAREQKQHRGRRGRRHTSAAALQLIKTGIKRLRGGSGRGHSLSSVLRGSDVEENSVDIIAADFVDGKAVEEDTSKILANGAAVEMKDGEEDDGQKKEDANDDDDDEDPCFGTIIDADRKLFQNVQSRVQECLPQSLENSKQLPPTDNPRLLNTANTPSKIRTSTESAPPKDIPSRYPPRIQFGKYCITTWYSAPYPSEYARLNLLYICEYCLKYFKTEDVFKRHMSKCTTYHPPGNEIYRCQNISVFEVDGQISKLYCQQLCILAKLFLDHKTLYYDVEPFLFYVITVHDPHEGFHLVGYFSKEKRSAQKYNLSCIMVLPPYQKQAYGRFLIDFSYLLSRIEGLSGSPEKPLSDLGRLSYESYWRSTLLPLILSTEEGNNGGTLTSDITVRQLTEATGIDVHDVVSTLQQLASDIQLDSQDSRPMLTFDMEKLSKLKSKYEARSKNWIKLDEECLRWSPLTDTKNIKSPPEDGGSHSSRLASPPARHSSPKVVSPSSPLRVPAPTPAPSLSPANSSAPFVTFQTPKRRRGRPPRKTSFITSSPMPPTPLAALQPSANTASTLLEAFPLPVLDVADPTVSTTTDSVVAVVAKKEEVVTTPKSALPSPKPPSCKKDSLLFAPQHPPDSPPSGGSASSMSTSVSTGINVTVTTSSTTNSNTKVSAANGSGGRTPSRGKGRDSMDSDIVSDSNKRLTGRRLNRRLCASMRCRDIRIFGVSNSNNGHDATVSESNKEKEVSTIVLPMATTPDTPRSIQSPILCTVHSSPIEAARSGDLTAGISPLTVVNTAASVSASLTNLLPVTTFEQLSLHASPVDANTTASDIFCPRSYSLPQMKIPSSSPPSPPLLDSAGGNVKAGFHCCLGVSRRLNRKSISMEHLEIFGPCPKLSLLTDSRVKLSVSLESSSTIPMVATPCSPTSSVDTLDSELTLPMRQETFHRRLRLPTHLRNCCKGCSLLTRHLKMAMTVDGSAWLECEPLGQRAERVTYHHVEAKPFVGEPLHCCRVDECQVYTATLVPQTPYSTDSLSSTSPPFVFHNSTSISPTVEVPSVSTSTTVTIQQNPHPPSPVFPARPLSPIQLPPPPPPPDGVNASSNSSTQSPFVYPTYTPPQPCCPMYVSGVAWMATPHHFSSAFIPPPAPAFFDPATGAPMFAYCLPAQPTPPLPPTPSPIQQVPLQTFLPQPDQALLCPPPPPSPALLSQQQVFPPQMGYVPTQPIPIPEHQNQHQQQQFQQLQPQFPLMMDATDWVLGGTPSAYPLQG